MGKNTNLSFKILIVGDVSTGKTSIVKRYVHDLYSDHHKSTIGVDFALKQIEIDGNNIRLQLWDIAGQDRFGSIDACGTCLVFDKTKQTTFETAKRWKEELDEKVKLPNGQPVPVILLANKCDIVEGQIPDEEIDEFCKSAGFVGWFSTSAKENINISNSITALAKAILEYADILECIKSSELRFLIGKSPNSDIIIAEPLPQNKCCYSS